MVRGVGLVEHAIAVELPDPEEAWRVLGAPDLVHVYAPFLPARSDEVNPLIAFIVAASQSLGMRDFGPAGLLRDAIVQALADVFEQVDVLLLPTTATPAFAAAGPMPSEIAGRSMAPLATVAQTYVFNLSGHPAISVPAGMVGGAPVGLQIVGRRHDDLRVLALAAAFERLQPWPRLAPAAL